MVSRVNEVLGGVVCVLTTSLALGIVRVASCAARIFFELGFISDNLGWVWDVFLEIAIGVERCPRTNFFIAHNVHVPRLRTRD
jgi:hypothetical protein